MRINAGELVMVHPRHSLRFAKRWGIVVEVDYRHTLPVKIKFSQSNNIYGFCDYELITRSEFEEMKNKKQECLHCGKDTTGEFAFTCESCEDKLLEE